MYSHDLSTVGSSTGVTDDAAIVCGTYDIIYFVLRYFVMAGRRKEPSPLGA